MNLFGKNEKPSEETVEKAIEQATTEAMNVFQAIIEKRKDEIRPINGFDHIVVAKIAEQFIGFSYFTLFNQVGRDAADGWLKIALKSIEATVTDISKRNVRIPLVWVNGDDQ